jgi:heme/copper-type cytochrome/quinol oxidase subunit 3
VSAQPGTAPIPVERPELEARILTVGSYLLAAGTAFFFIAFLFAFFYLRELNSNGLWHSNKPGQQFRPGLGFGIAVFVCVLVSVVLVRFALRELRTSARPIWRLAGLVALLAGLAAVGLQCWEYTRLGVATSLTLAPEREGGYASVYLGWTGLFTIFVFGSMLWLETILASSSRSSGVPQEEIRTGVTGLSLFLTMLGLVEITAFILLYEVK